MSFVFPNGRMATKAERIAGLKRCTPGSPVSEAPSTKPALPNVGPAIPGERPQDPDRFGNLKPVCTIRVVPADPRIDPGFARPAERKVDPAMVVPSGCRR